MIEYKNNSCVAHSGSWYLPTEMGTPCAVLCCCGNTTLVRLNCHVCCGHLDLSQSNSLPNSGGFFREARVQGRMRVLESALHLLIFWMNLSHWDSSVLFHIDSFMELWWKNLLCCLSSFSSTYRGKVTHTFWSNSLGC